MLFRAISISFLVLLCIFSGKAQEVLFFETFNTGIPNNFVLIDNDKAETNAPAISPPLANPMSFKNVGWATFQLGGLLGRSAWSTSKHIDTAVQADDWLILPSIQLDTFSLFVWQALSLGDSNGIREDYEVRISRNSVSIDSFLANPPLRVIKGESSSAFITRVVRLDTAGYSLEPVHIAIRNNSLNKFMMAVDNIILLKEFSYDLQITDIDLPFADCKFTGNDSITITVANVGREAVSNMPMVYEMIEPDGNVLSRVVDTFNFFLAANVNRRFTFDIPFDFNQIQDSIMVRAYAEVPGDAFHENDTAVEWVYKTNIEQIPFVNDFDSYQTRIGWKSVNVDRKGGSWIRLNGGGLQKSGAIMYGYRSNGIDQGNDWLFSKCIDLKKDELYQLSFYTRVLDFRGGLTTPENLSVFIGREPEIDSMFNKPLDAYLGFNNPEWEVRNIAFEVPSDGVYNLGFYTNSDASLDDYLFLEDVAVKLLQQPQAGFRVTTNGTAVILENTTSGQVDSFTMTFGDGLGVFENFQQAYSYGVEGEFEICLTAYNQIGQSTFCQKVDLIVGIDDISSLQDHFKVFPNPARDKIYIQPAETLKNSLQVSLYDLLGRKAKEQILSTESIMSLDISELNQGAYLLHINQNGKVYTDQIMISY